MNDLIVTDEVSSGELDAIRMKIAETEQALLTGDPQMTQYLKMIHANLLTNPELVHMLKDEERAVIINGLSKMADVVIVAAAKKTTAKKLASHTVDDI